MIAPFDETSVLDRTPKMNVDERGEKRGLQLPCGTVVVEQFEGGGGVCECNSHCERI